jgi:hypothetical protein
VVDVAFCLVDLTWDKILFDGQESAPLPDARRIARQPLPALPSPGSKEAAGIARSMMGLELRQEKLRQGRIPTFAHPVQHKRSQVHLLGQVSHRQEQLPLQAGRQAPG